MARYEIRKQLRASGEWVWLAYDETNSPIPASASVIGPERCEEDLKRYLAMSKEENGKVERVIEI